MIRLTVGNRRLCDGLKRRTFFRVASAETVGLNLTLPSLLRAAFGRSKARSLILFALEGGPSHLSTPPTG